MALFDPARAERDACGIGFVADAAGVPARAIVDAALDALARLEHRGATAADRLTGDGAGVLLPIPDVLVEGASAADGGRRRGIAMVFASHGDEGACRRALEAACAAEDVGVAAWRPVPTDDAALGARARATAPVIEQAVLVAPGHTDDDDAERRAFRARRRAEHTARRDGLGLYIPSLSFRTVVYKALCAAGRLAEFYRDLADDRLGAWFALFHQRYSTNTTPSWERAQPFRLLGHNGEINTIRGNAAYMRAREGRLGAGEICPEELLAPAVDAGNSDSGILDEVLELLVRAGRDMTHACSMLVPPAWERARPLPTSVRDFFRWHSCIIEPWDGPAALVLADGRGVTACLDRNGLRPLRVAVCDDGLVAVASEAGAVATEGHGRVRRGKLGPGEMLHVDPARGVIDDHSVKAALSRGKPYGAWARRRLVPCSTGEPVAVPGRHLTARQVTAGYTKEETTVILRPMAVEGREPVSSMGDDTAQPPLAAAARPPFAYLKQRFAQVTNPPIDHLRERDVMSVRTRLGPRPRLLSEEPDAVVLRDYDSFLLWPSAVADLEEAGALVLDATFAIVDGPDALAGACRALAAAAESAVRDGTQQVVVSDRAVGPDRAPIPSVLAAGAVHHRLVEAGLRCATAIVVDADDVREAHHCACLLTNGADAVCPRLAFESIASMASAGRLGNLAAAEAQRRFAAALEDGVLKVMSKMGISSLDSYRGAQVIEAVGLGHDVIATCMPGVSSVMGGLSFVELGADVVLRHDAGFAARTAPTGTGFIKFRRGGEYHAFNPDVVDALHEVAGVVSEPRDDAETAAAHLLRRAVRGDPDAYARFAALVDGRPPAEPRDLLVAEPAGAPVAVDDVEPPADIVRRFSTGAMSHGALSAEAHETLAVALNRIGGGANSGEGGEAPERYGTPRNCGIKQIASGRFGVTPAYVASAHELQIKMAQGSKPGEGGQLPGGKVSVEIARIRHTVPGVGLISPPPHHDIYSIEDLAQLIYDLKQANAHAAVSVKLVASEGVGTIAAGVAKGLADVVHIAGADGGTGASPLASIKHAGLPWEIGLVDAQSALSENGLRGRVRLRVDGGLKTGRDVVMAALLGADEYSFGTAALVAQGCILVRTCHRNTCPVGIATQDPELRARFSGTPEMVVRYLMSVADEVRARLAALGLRSMDEAIGRTELLRPRRTGDARADSLDPSALIARCEGERRFRAAAVPRHSSQLGDRLFEDGMAAVRARRPALLPYAITTAERSVGARLGCAVAAEPGRPHGPVRATFAGAAGQSFGAFCTEGMELVLTGEANDYVGKGMGGGRIVIRPPADDAGNPCLAGNTVLYGATGGQLFVAGRVGERFAVRNSGAVAVVEGTGDHACEYMTAGAVVILGPTGINLAAGMSGGEAYVLDETGDLDARLNPQLVGAYAPSAAQMESLRRVVERHRALTGSAVAASLLSTWGRAASAFTRIAPVAEVARLEALFAGAPAA